MSSFTIKGKFNSNSLPTFGGNVEFIDCKITIAGKLIEESFTGTISELKEKYPELEASNE